MTRSHAFYKMIERQQREAALVSLFSEPKNYDLPTGFQYDEQRLVAEMVKDPSPPFVHHNQESQDAAHAIKPKAGTLRAQVFELLKTGSFTDQQIAERLQLDPSTARPRRIELVTAGLVEQDGTAITASGRKAALWKSR